MSRSFAAYEAKLGYSKPLTARYSLLTRLAPAGTAGEASLYSLYRLGGLSNLSALSRQQLIGNKMYYGHVYLLRSLARDSIAVFGKFYGVIGYEVGKAWFPGRSARPRQDGLIGLAGATQLGFFFFGGAIGDQGDKKILFRLGRTF